MEKPGDFERCSVFETKMLLGSSDDGGLSGKEATKRLREYGRNELEEKRPPSVAERMLSQLMDPLIYVLLAAGGISVFLGERGDAVIIAAVVLLNATVGVIQEGKAQKALESLKKLTTRKALVRRDGKLLEMDAAELVPGDRVLLNAGAAGTGGSPTGPFGKYEGTGGITYRRVCTGGKGCAVCGFDRNTSR